MERAVSQSDWCLHCTRWSGKSLLMRWYLNWSLSDQKQASPVKPGVWVFHEEGQVSTKEGPEREASWGCLRVRLTGVTTDQGGSVDLDDDTWAGDSSCVPPMLRGRGLDVVHKCSRWIVLYWDCVVWWLGPREAKWKPEDPLGNYWIVRQRPQWLKLGRS